MKLKVGIFIMLIKCSSLGFFWHHQTHDYRSSLDKDIFFDNIFYNDNKLKTKACHYQVLGFYLPNNIFIHRQHYVIISRVGTKDELKILVFGSVKKMYE